jgi:hypothetical protein
VKQISLICLSSLFFLCECAMKYSSIAPIFHDDRKNLFRWVASQNRYMLLEADKLSKLLLSLHLLEIDIGV